MTFHWFLHLSKIIRISVIKESHIAQDTPDDHVFIVIECPSRPAISIDMMNHHGRRCVCIRVDGMSFSSLLVDLKELRPKGEKMFRYCGMCGVKIDLNSSRNHACTIEDV